MSAALKTILSFNYQVLIGLEKCFSLDESQSIWIERDGDVSLIGEGSEASSQIEVKNYSDALTDNHENLWKTLKNWLNTNKFDHQLYAVLVLHTTQPFGVKTILKNWNADAPEERIKILKNIYSKRSPEELSDENPSDIVKFQKAVMESDPDMLMKVVSKVSLFTEADDDEQLKANVISRISGIPKNNVESYLQGLIGFVYAQAESKSWKVTKKDFDQKCEELTASFSRKEFTFPPFISYEASGEEVEKYQEKLFVKKIIDIEHDIFIPDAVGDWMQLYNSLNEDLDASHVYADKTKDYQNKIIEKFKLKHNSAKLKLNNVITDSKVLYNRVIEEDPLQMDGFYPPIEYRNGLVHDAMDDEEKDLKWSLD